MLKSLEFFLLYFYFSCCDFNLCKKVEQEIYFKIFNKNDLHFTYWCNGEIKT